MRRLRSLIGLAVTVAVLLAAVAGCAQPTPAPAPAPQQAASPATQPTAAPTQAPAQPTAAPTQAAAQPTAAPTQAPAQPTDGGVAESITIAGSTTVQPLAEKLAEAYSAVNPKVQVTVQGGGSSVGVKSAGQGTTDMGMSSREIKQSELDEFKDLKVFPIAYDGIAIVVHSSVTVDDLTIEQVRDIFSGKITNWNQVGGPNKMIVVVSREEGSGTRGAFEELVMGKDAQITANAILQPSNGAVRTTVATTPDAVGYLSFGYLDASVKTVRIAGADPTPENVVSGVYPVVRPLIMLTKGEPTGAVKAWLDFILGADGQQIVKEQHYIPVP